MVRYPQPYCPSLRVLESLGNLAARLQYKCVGTGSKRFDQAVCPVFDSSINADLRQIRANEREIMILVCLPNSANSVNGSLVTDVAAKCVAGVCRIRDEATSTDNLNDFRDKSLLRVFGMNFYQSRHARIVAAHSGPCSANSAHFDRSRK